NTYGGNTTINDSGGTISVTGTLGADVSPASYAGQISIGSSGTFSYGSSSNQTLTGKITGAGAVTKAGSSTLTLSPSSASDYTGLTSVTAGTLKITLASSLGGYANSSQRTTVSSGATLEVAGAVTSAELLSIAGTGVSSAGAVNFTAAGTLSGTVEMTADSTIQVSDSIEATVSGVISGAATPTAAGLTKGGTGTGTLTLTAANTYTGTTSISVGTVKITDAKALGETFDGTTRSTTTVSSGATLQVAASVTSAEPLTISGSGADSGSGTGSIRIISDNDFALFYGDSSNVTSLKYQSNVDWPQQQASASSLDISDAGSYIYIVQMGGGGTEDIGGALNNIDITTISGVQRVTAGTGCGSATSGGWYLITSCIAGYNDPAVANGTQDVTLTQLQTALVGVTWGSMPTSKTSGVGSDATFENGTRIGRAYDSPSSQAVVFRIPTTTVVAPGAIYYTAAGTLSGTVTLAANSKVQVLDGVTGTISGVVSGSYGLTKGGAGTLALTNANTYTGATTISAGTARITNATALGESGATRSTTTVSSGATLEVAAVITSAEPLTVNGTTATNGAIYFSDSGTLSGDTTLASTSSVNVASTKSAVMSGTISGTSMGLTKQGNGTLSISGANTYTGTTSVAAGTLALSGANERISNSSAVVVSNNATFNLAGFNETVASIATSSASDSAASITLGAATLTSGDSSSTTFAGVISDGSDTGAIVKQGTGTLTLSGANTYDGATTVNAGILVASNNNSLGSSSGGVTVASGATLQVQGGVTIEDWPTISGTGASGVGALRNFSDTNTFTRTIALDATSTITSTAGTLQLTGSAISATSANLTFDGAGDTSVSSILASGIGNLTKSGAGSLTLSGSGSYSGSTTISAGTLKLGANGVIPDASAVTVADGATFDLVTYSEEVGSIAASGTGALKLGTSKLFAGGDNTSTTFAGPITGSGELEKKGSGKLTLSGTNTFTGKSTVSGGTLSIAADAKLGTAPGSVVADQLTLNGGTLEVTASVAISANRGITIGSNDGTISVGSTLAVTYAGTIAGEGNDLTKSGTGTLTVSGANSYTGATTVSAGTLAISGSDERISNSSAVTVASGATFDLASLNETVGSIAGAGSVSTGTNAAKVFTAGGDNSSTTYEGVISGSSGFTKAGSGTLTFSGASTNTYTGTTTVSAGVLALGAASRIADTSALSISNSGTFDLAGFDETVASIATVNSSDSAAKITLSSTSTTNTLTTAGNASTTFAGIIEGTNGKVTKSGTGTLTLSGASTFTGALTISAGTVSVGAGSTLGSIDTQSVVNAGTLTFNRSDAVTYSGVVSSTGALTQAGSGTLTLSGVNTYTGTTSVSAGTLKLGTAGGRIADTSAVSIADSAVFDLSGFDETVASITTSGTGSGAKVTLSSTSASNTLTTAGNASTTFAGVVEGTNGGLTKQGTGTLSLTGANSFTGALTISGGTVSVGGGSTTGSIATASVVNSATLLFNRSDALTYAGVVSGSGALQKSGAGTLSLSGTNTYSGATTINTTGGNITISGSGSLGTLSGSVQVYAGDIVVTSASSTFTFGSSTAQEFSGVISGEGALTKNTGTNRLTLSGNNTYTGVTTVSNGFLGLSHNNALGGSASGQGTTIADGATLDVYGYTSPEPLTISGGGQSEGGAISFGSGTGVLSGTIALAADSRIQVGYTVGRLSGVVSGAYRLTKYGQGTLELTAANTYSGGTTVSGGLLSIGVGGTTGSITGDVINNSELRFDRSDALTYSGAISGTGALQKQGAGTLTLSGASSYTGNTTISVGVVAISNNTALGTAAGSTTVASGAALSVSGTLTVAEPITVSGTGISSGGAIRNTANSNTLTGLVTLAADTEIQSDSGTLTFDPSSGSAITGTFNLSFDANTGNVSVADPIA
ncbi:MAG: autotransporter-associated beta strand repeat-containing protein, partial [Actinomycetota bacterium]